jgi:two-component system, chemotaxis family, protein-glutamate methylesterase/glutaminase
MAPIRILVVDDSVVIRKLLADTLSADRALEVVGVASDGRIALAKIALLRPDLVTLDIEMPVMDGLQTLVELRKLYPTLPIIMFSTLTERGAAATLDALSLGASDYATKPSSTGSTAVALERIRIELIPKIKALCGIAPLKHAAQLPRQPDHRGNVMARLLVSRR